MSGECDQQYGGKRESDIGDARRSLWKFPLPEPPPAEEPNHSARCKSESHMQEEVSFKLRSFQLPLPSRQSTRNRQRRRQCRRHKVIVCGLRHRWIPFPHREEIKHHANNEQRNRKMNDYWVLRVFRKQGSLEVKWVNVVRDWWQ